MRASRAQGITRMPNVKIWLLTVLVMIAMTVAVYAEEELLIDDFDSENNWLPSHNVAALTLTEQKYGTDTRSCLQVTPNQLTEYSSVMRMFGSSKPFSLYEYGKVSYKIYIAPPEDDAGESYTVLLTLHSGTHKSEHRSKVNTGMWYTVTADISDWFRRADVNAIEIAVWAESETTAGKVHGGSFLIDTVTAYGEPDTVLADTFLSGNYEGFGCDVSYDSEQTVMKVERGEDASSSPYIRGNVDVEDRSLLGSFNAVRIVLENDSSCEGLRLDYAGENDIVYSDEKTSSTALTPYGALTSYLLPIAPDASLDSLKFTFSGSWSGEIRVHAISLVTIADSRDVAADNAIGTVSRCTVSGDFISVKGTVNADMAAQYINAKLNLYELPAYASAKEITPETEPVLSLAMSTRFEFKLPMQRSAYKRLTYKYVVAVIDGGKVIFVDTPKYVTNSSALLTAVSQQETVSAKGIHDTGIDGIFETGCPYVVLDIVCEKLLVPRGSLTGAAKLHARDGYYYYFDSAYIRYLDDRVKLYTASGSEVIMRLVASDNLASESMTYETAEEAVYYAVNTSTDPSINQLCAIVEFLSMRYNGGVYGEITGFIAGMRADAFRLYNNAGAVSENLTAYVKNYADCLRIIYAVASEYIPQVRVYASVGDGEIYASDRALLAGADGGYHLLTGWSPWSVDAALFVELLCRRISEEGLFPWYLMYEIASDGETAGEILRCVRTMDQLTVRMARRYACAPIGTSVFWQPERGYTQSEIASTYTELFRLNAEARCADALILSAARQEWRSLTELLRTLKYLDTGLLDDNIAAQTELIQSAGEVFYEGDEGPHTEAYTGHIDYWNFTNAYDAQGWFAGEGALSVSTEKNAPLGSRVLRAVMEGGETGGMLWASETDAGLNMTYAPEVELELMITPENSAQETVEVVVVFGADTGRAEYTCEVRTGVPLQFRADVSDFSGANAVTYVAVLVRSAGPCSASLVRATGSSRIYTDSEISALSGTAVLPDDTDAFRLTMVEIMAIAAVVIFTLTVILLLSRKRQE